MLVFTGSADDIALGTVSSAALESLSYVDDHTLEQWNAWKKFIKGLTFENFLFVEGICPRDPTYSWVALINIPKTVEMVQRHEIEFRKILRDQHLDSATIIRALISPQSKFLEAVFSDHYLSGLLHGYGEENSRIFSEARHDETAHLTLTLPTEIMEGPVTYKQFPLPTYAACAKDSMKLKYQKQRTDIQKVYHDGDIVNITLKCLH